MISSLAGVNPIAGMAAYCASKAGLDYFAASLMLEVRQRGIKVTTAASITSSQSRWNNLSVTPLSPPLARRTRVAARSGKRRTCARAPESPPL